MRTIVLTGGGTAGHVLPNIALLPGLRKQFDKIYYIGGDGVEKTIAAQNGLPYYQITTVKLRRKLTLRNLCIPYKLWKGIHEARKILQQIKPDIIFSKGGFVALPVVFAAAQLKIKVVAHESDISLGLANRLTVKKCTTLCTTFPLKIKHPNVIQTGAIIRDSIYHGDKTQINLGDQNKPNLLIMGGSSGAVAINQAVWRALKPLCERFNVLHVTGKGKGNTNYQNPNYSQVEYLERPENAFAWANVVVARSGSGTVSELLALKKPALYIPLPKAESRGDQIQNADYLLKLGVCEILPQEKIDDETFLAAILSVYRHRAQIMKNCAKQDWIDGTQQVLNCLQQN